MAVPTFEIFLGYFEREALWVEAVRGFGSASRRMRQRAEEFPGPYFVFCTRTHRVLASIDTSEQEIDPSEQQRNPTRASA